MELAMVEAHMAAMADRRDGICARGRCQPRETARVASNDVRGVGEASYGMK
jgi:hypothetical protein